MTARWVRLAWALRALLSHYWRHPWQSVFLLAGLVAGVGLWSAVQVINSHARASYAQADRILGAQAAYWIRARDGGGIDPDDYIALRRAGFREVFPLLQARVSTADDQPLYLIATDLMALPGAMRAGGAGAAVDWLALIQPPYEAWFPAQVADELGVTAGTRLLLRDGRRLPPARIASRSGQGRQIFMDLGAAFHVLGSRRLSSLAVSTIDPARRARLEAALPAGLHLEPNRQRLDLTELTRSLHTHLTAMSLLSFAVGLFIVFNAVRFSLWYRRPTLRNLRLMGVSLRLIAVAIGVETLLWSGVGTAAGLLAGWGISHALLPSVSASLQNLYGAVVGAQLLLSARTVLLAWSLTLVGLVVALAWPLWLQLRGQVLAAGSAAAGWQADVRARRHLLWGALALALAALGVQRVMDSVAMGFVLLALVLFAAAWALPALLAGAHGLVARRAGRGALRTRWVLSDGWAQLPALRTAMMALLLALTANLGVETLVGSFRTALSDWMDQRIGADVYVNSPRLDVGALVDAGSRGGWLAHAHARIGVLTRWHDRPTRVLGMDVSAPDMARLPLADAEADALARWRASGAGGEALILANEQAHYLGGLVLGDTVRLETDRGPATFRVAGFFHDYGNALFQFYLPKARMRALWPDAAPFGTALWLAPGADRPVVEAALQRAGAAPGEWIDQGDIKRLSLNIFERTFAMTAAMNTLTLLVAGSALLTALLAILHERLPEFARWRALGVTRAELLAVVGVPLGVFALLTWALSVPLGALLSWLLIHELNVISFGWSMPMRWSPLPALGLLGLVALIVAIALGVVQLLLRRRLPQAMAQLGSGA
ncbi:ABC transporter permease [Nitrogeniibacter mangrovi]|uniref:ABC transporter permease n=1 Tax=Nitrogeniibacter mangrovi TaxID=2016596 RepID=A0A6C1B7R1_9RHOO|nr:ABC transporter permease [Nitrogeniibacter mangrovi]QID18350.1 ABC transporter permease [Nitrogeniibacter mangrovi]